MHPSCETSGEYLLSEGPRGTPGPEEPIWPFTPGSQELLAMQPSLDHSFLLFRKIICYDQESVVKWSWISLYNHHVKIVEPLEAQNSRERKEGTEEGWGGGGGQVRRPLLFPGVFCQGLGVAFSFKGWEPFLTVQCEDPQPFTVPLPWRPWPVSRAECTTTRVK